MSKNGKVTILVPAKNEIEGMKWFMPKIKKEWYDDLIVIDGNSTDGTAEYCRENGYKIINQKGAGVSWALADAMPEVQEGIVITVSPDGNTLPEHIPALIAKMREGYDMVIVSRYLAGAQSHDDDAFTGVGNSVLTKLINLLFRCKFTDTLVIYRAYTTDAIRKMKLGHQSELNWYRKRFFALESWDLASCMRAAKLGLKTAEIPGDEPARIGGERKLSIVRHGTGAMLQIIYEFLSGKSFK